MNRSLKIDTLRGIACVLLITYHVIGSNPNNGLRITDGVYRELNDLLAYLRMPLFTFLSGVVYAYRPFEKRVMSFIIKKSRRLLLPMLTVGTSFAVLQSIVPGTNDSISHWYLLHIIPVAHFWFVEALFILFIFVVTLEKLNIFSGGIKFLVVLLIVCSLYLSSFHYPYFAVNGCVYLAPYFLFGMGIQRYKIFTEVIFTTKLKLLLLIITITIYSLVYVEVVTINESRSLFGLMLGFLSCITLYSCDFQSRFFAKIGCYSYSIYIFHVFFTASSRMFLTKIGIHQLEVIIILSAFCGIYGPIVMELILDKSCYARMFFIGKAPRMKTLSPVNINLSSA